jgi:hypothetical protein
MGGMLRGRASPQNWETEADPRHPSILKLCEEAPCAATQRSWGPALLNTLGLRCQKTQHTDWDLEREWECLAQHRPPALQKEEFSHVQRKIYPGLEVTTRLSHAASEQSSPGALTPKMMTGAWQPLLGWALNLNPFREDYEEAAAASCAQGCMPSLHWRRAKKPWSRCLPLRPMCPLTRAQFAIHNPACRGSKFSEDAMLHCYLRFHTADCQ